MAKDAFGNELSVGDRVIYNLSGELAVGRIHRINPAEGHRGRLPYPEYHSVVTIAREQVAGGRQYFNNATSKVRNTNGIVKLDAI